MDTVRPITSNGAVASLVLGILSLAFFGLFAGIPAVICGHIALANMKKDSQLAGRRMAIVGVALGYVGIAVSIIVLLAFAIVYAKAARSATDPFAQALF